MRVNVDGGKYTIWRRLEVHSPYGLVSAYELACLRKIVAGVVGMLDAADRSDNAIREALFGAKTIVGGVEVAGGIDGLVRHLECYADIRRSLNDPLDL